MSITRYLREIGRGKDGARSLDAAQAEDLLHQVLDGRVSEVQLGAFVIAMRIKGESAAELTGFLSAAQAHIAPAIVDSVERSAQPVVWLPSYNGARRLANLTALLAGLLARMGLAVIVHGRAEDPGRVTTHAVFEALGWPIVETAAGADAVAGAWQLQRPVFVTTDVLCPALARLLDVRAQVGLRNSGHTIAKLLAPSTSRRSLRVVNHTHPEYATSLAQFLAVSRADALLLRGTEGEPVADPRRLPRLDVCIGGQARPELGRAAQEGVLAQLPLLPREHDAATTAHYIQAVASGAKPAPAPVQAQAECLVQALAAAVSSPAAQPRVLLA